MKSKYCTYGKKTDYFGFYGYPRDNYLLNKSTVAASDTGGYC